MLYKSKNKIVSTGKKPITYCDKDRYVFVIEDRGVLICYSEYGFFPCKKEELTEIKMDARELIKAIKQVDSKMSYGFPFEFVYGILENKDWKEEFIWLLKKSDVRETIKNQILKYYEKDNIQS